MLRLLRLNWVELATTAEATNGEANLEEKNFQVIAVVQEIPDFWLLLPLKIGLRKLSVATT